METRVILVLMVRNEVRILRRCIQCALPFVDAVLVSDTGSSDATVEAARLCMQDAEQPLCISTEEWRDFGRNRTASMQACRAFCKDLEWSTERTFALVLDADMQFRCASKGALLEHLQKKPLLGGLSVKQVNGELEYYNTRLMRLSDTWFCEGVTHEYWTGGGPSEELPAALAWIEDLGDGGCKADKFARDERLLLAGLEENPRCERYLFYLAQTYHCMNRDEEAIEWYKKRIEAGGWVEEVWYAHLMIARTHLKHQRHLEAEAHVEQGLALQPDRVEGLLALVTHFRGASQPFKAWHYLRLAEQIERPSGPKLFLEAEAYGHKLDYERCLLHFYVKPEARPDGALLCLRYEGPLEGSAMLNLSCYADQMTCSEARRLDFPAPPGFCSNSVAVDETGTQLCVRTVSYHITPEGSYVMRDGLIETLNFLASWDRATLTWGDWRPLLLDAASTDRWRREDTIRGLEDVRLCQGAFTATTREFSYTDKNRMVHGRLETGAFRPVEPPRGETACEKNWVPVSSTEVVYEWHPLTVGAVESGFAQLQITHEHPTPRWFRHLRGSTPPVELEDGLWLLTHIVSPRSPRVYLHAWVLLAKEDYRPLAYSPPFFLRHLGIEYCLGATTSLDGKRFGVFVSVWDRESWYCEMFIEDCRRWLRKLE
jgi:glycosyltransferase involved in cell wall biosynthesis